LSADEPLPLEVLDAIRVADCEDGSAEQVARLEARLAPLFQAPQGTQPSVRQAAPSSGGSLGALKMAAASVALFGVAMLMWPQQEQAGRRSVNSLQVSSAQRGTPAPMRAETRVAPFEVAELRAPTREPQVEESAPQLATAIADAPAPATTHSRAEPRDSRAAQSARDGDAAGSQNTLALEARLLSRARRSLESQPEQALALAERHQLRFPHGVLGEEREAIAIKALRRTGQDALAAQRQARFLARYPQSPHAMSLAASARP
jgi:hypothetical protein